MNWSLTKTYHLQDEWIYLSFFKDIFYTKFCYFVSYVLFSFFFTLTSIFFYFLSLSWDSWFSSLFSWYEFCCRFYVGIDEVLIFVIRSRCFWYLLKCIEVWLFGLHSFVGSVVSLPWQFGDRKIHSRKRNIPHNSMCYYSISYLWECSQSVL